MRKSELFCDCDIIHIGAVNFVKERVLNEHTLLLMKNFYKAFADSTRIKIINALYNHELCVCDIAVLLNMTKSAVSHQLKYLRGLDAVKSRKEGKVVFYSLSDQHVKLLFEMCYQHVQEATNE